MDVREALLYRKILGGGGVSQEQIDEIAVAIGIATPSNVVAILNKLDEIIATSNNTTGESDATLTDAVQSLIDGYGGGGGGGFSFTDFTKFQELTYVCAKTDNNWQTDLAHSLGVVPKMMLFFVVPSTSFSSDERTYVDIQLFDSLGNPHYHTSLAGSSGVVTTADYQSGTANYTATDTMVRIFFRGYSQAGWTYRIYLWG